MNEESISNFALFEIVDDGFGKSNVVKIVVFSCLVQADDRCCNSTLSDSCSYLAQALNNNYNTH